MTADPNRTTTGTTCDVCGEPGDLVARDTYWRHPRCVRRVAGARTMAAIWAIWDATEAAERAEHEGDALDLFGE